MTLELFEVDADGALYCPADPGRITHNVPWPTTSGSWSFSEPAYGIALHTEVGYEHNVIDEFNNGAAQASAFFSNGMDGHLHQYGPIGRGWKAWTQAAGNPHWRGIEHEDHGNPDNPFTEAQLETTAAVIEACSHHDGFPIQPTDNVDGRGVIFHVDGGLAWGGHQCPGAVRMSQRPALLAYADQLRAKRNGTTPAQNPGPAPSWVKRPDIKVEDEDMTKLYKTKDDGAVYAIEGNTKRHIVSEQALTEEIATGKLDGTVHIVSKATLDSYPTVK